MRRLARSVVVFALALGGTACTFKAILVADGSPDGPSLESATEAATDAPDVPSDIAADAMLDSSDVTDAFDVTDAGPADTCPTETCDPPSNDNRTGAILIFATAGADAGSMTDASNDGAADATMDSPSDVARDTTDVASDATGMSDTTDTPAMDTSADAADAGANAVSSTLTVHGASTVRATHSIDAPCDPARGGADVFYSFVLGDRELVYADTLSASWHTILFFTDAAGVPINASGYRTCDVNFACAQPTGSQIVALLNPGTYYLVLSGSSGDTGVTDIRVKHLPVGGGAVVPLDRGMSTHDGNLMFSSANDTGFCASIAGGGSDAYWWATCPSDGAGTLAAMACPTQFVGALWSAMYFRTADADAICSTQMATCGFGSAVMTTVLDGARLNVLYVAGHAAGYTGVYRLTAARP